MLNSSWINTITDFDTALKDPQRQILLFNLQCTSRPRLLLLPLLLLLPCFWWISSEHHQDRRIKWKTIGWRHTLNSLPNKTLLPRKATITVALTFFPPYRKKSKIFDFLLEKKRATTFTRSRLFVTQTFSEEFYSSLLSDGNVHRVVFSINEIYTSAMSVVLISVAIAQFLARSVDWARKRIKNPLANTSGLLSHSPSLTALYSAAGFRLRTAKMAGSTTPHRSLPPPSLTASIVYVSVCCGLTTTCNRSTAPLENQEMCPFRRCRRRPLCATPRSYIQVLQRPWWG